MTSALIWKARSWIKETWHWIIFFLVSGVGGVGGPFIIEKLDEYSPRIKRFLIRLMGHWLRGACYVYDKDGRECMKWGGVRVLYDLL